MVGWRNYLAAGLTALGLSFMPYTVSTGTGGSNDSDFSSKKVMCSMGAKNLTRIEVQNKFSGPYFSRVEKLADIFNGFSYSDTASLGRFLSNEVNRHLIKK